MRRDRCFGFEELRKAPRGPRPDLIPEIKVHLVLRLLLCAATATAHKGSRAQRSARLSIFHKYAPATGYFSFMQPHGIAGQCACACKDGLIDNLPGSADATRFLVPSIPQIGVLHSSISRSDWTLKTPPTAPASIPHTAASRTGSLSGLEMLLHNVGNSTGCW